jgi:hypothetical protein
MQLNHGSYSSAMSSSSSGGFSSCSSGDTHPSEKKPYKAEGEQSIHSASQDYWLREAGSWQ